MKWTQGKDKSFHGFSNNTVARHFQVKENMQNCTNQLHSAVERKVPTVKHLNGKVPSTRTFCRIVEKRC